MKTQIKLAAIFVTLILFSCKKNTDMSKDSRPKDFDGNVYDTIKIGTQVWMVANLKTTHYNDGTAIGEVEDSTAWSNISDDNTEMPAWCFFNKDAANNTTYGKLYNWYAVQTGKLAPSGWHVATDAEWTILTTYLGGESIAGDKLKATSLWISGMGTNSSGFTGLPGGYRFDDATFYDIRYYGTFWSSTAYDSNNAWDRSLVYSGSGVVRNHNYKGYGLSVRCVKD